VRRFLVCLILLTGLFTGATRVSAQAVTTDPFNHDPAVIDAIQHFYNLDFDVAQQKFQSLVAVHPNNPAALDYLLQTIVFEELYKEDLLDTTLYAHEGFLSTHHVTMEDPAIRAQVNQLTDRAVGLCDQELKANPNDVNALFARGMARSLKATYVGLSERSFVTGLHLALQARNDEARVLELDPNYVDAKLVVGIYYYVVAILPLPLRMMAGIVGIHGDKQKGLQMLEDCGRRGPVTSVAARTTLMLFYRHDARYNDAVAIAQSLEKQYPRNYLFALEVANLLKDAGNGPAAVAAYRSVIDNVARPHYYTSVRVELAWYGLAETERGQNHIQQALDAFNQVITLPNASADLKRRAREGAAQMQAQLHH
jgi:tetratricopeptide (TPR) repeat protein